MKQRTKTGKLYPDFKRWMDIQARSSGFDSTIDWQIDFIENKAKKKRGFNDWFKI